MAVNVEETFELLFDKKNTVAYRALQDLQRESEETDCVYAYMDRLSDMLENDRLPYYFKKVEVIDDMILYHASKVIVEFPEIRKTRYTKDFSWGFYCTNNLEQAIRWANRGEGDPVINYYSYQPVGELSILRFDQMSDEWLDFIARCRNGETHTYDIVEGPMANDTIWNYVNDFLAGRISRKQFWVLAEFRYPTHQMSFHTLSALNCLTFERSEIIYDRKRKK